MKTQIQKLASFKNALTLIVSLFALSVSAQIKVLNNNYLRMGNGNENSINAYGNVQQPFYFDGVSSTWRKLTYSTYPLDIAVAVGGDKTNNWNYNGTIVVNPLLSGQVIDYSGYMATSATTGWGVVKSTGTINIGGKLLRVEQTYTLPQSSGYIGIKVKVTNIDATLTENVRVWVGTRDDWVGTSDQPRKQRGNIVNGAFVQNTTTAQQALALKISSGSEAVLVYTNSNRGQTSVNTCCSFEYAMNTNPATSTFDVTNDGSYAFYMRLNDLAPNASDEFTWYYAAGSLANIDNIINEVAQASGSVQNITCNTATYNATATANGTGYWMAVPQGSPAPTAAQIKAGLSYGSVNVAGTGAVGNGAMTANTQRSFNITGLSQATNYTVYFVHEDATPQFSSVISSNFTTVNPTAAITASGNTTFCTGGSVTLNATSGSGLTYQWNNSNGAINGATNATYSASTTNTYTVTIGRAGCPNVTSAATQVTVNSNPTVTATANSGVAIGQTLSLSASGATTYSWSGPNGFTSNQANPSINNVSLAAAGTYTVVGTTNGCSASANTTVVINQPAKALHFDGVDDWVNVTNMPAINAIPVTLEAYVKPEMRTENTNFYPNNILSNDVPGNYGLGMGININSYGSQITIEYKNGFRSFYDNTIVAGQWVHIAVVYTNGKVETYINGVLKDVVNHNQAPLNGNTNMFIGRHNDDAGYGTRRFFKGVIDEVRVWNRALCAQEITSQYNCQLNGVGNGLFANYNFDNGLASANNAGITALNDTTANNGNGVLNNFALNGNTSNWILQGGSNGVCANYIVSDVNVKGNNTTIYDGTTALSVADFTNMGSAILGNAVSKSFTIENTGTGTLNISNINFTGVNAADYSVSGITLPATLAAGASANITVSMNATTVGTRNATINITTDDCDESVYNFNLTAQISCVPVAITNCPQTQYQQIYADSNLCSAVFNYEPTIAGTAATVSYTFTGATTGSGSGTGSGSRFNVGQTNVTINVTGTCGTASCSFVVTVVDNIVPKAISKNTTVYLNAAGTASVTPADIDNGSYDNCGTVTLSMSQTGTICGFAT
ncbi:MAG: LamG-like jellyroll fold domain-containing protein, partial [Bacteroidia bacterium]